jgi:hypothetical protein
MTAGSLIIGIAGCDVKVFVDGDADVRLILA